MIEICNFNRTRDFGKPGDARCDRSTKWGNPFICYEEKNRDRVCDLYEDYLDAITIPNNEKNVKMLLKIGGLTETQINSWMMRTGGFLDLSDLKGAKRIFCFCSPRRCHCDYLRKKLLILEEPILVERMRGNE